MLGLGDGVRNAEDLDWLAGVLVVDVRDQPVGVPGTLLGISVQTQGHVTDDLLAMRGEAVKPVPGDDGVRRAARRSSERRCTHRRVDEVALAIVLSDLGVAVIEGTDEAILILPGDADRDQPESAGGVTSVGQRHGAIIGGPTEATLVLHVTEDTKARAGERLVRARDHALDHGWWNADRFIGVEREVNEMALLSPSSWTGFLRGGLLTEDQWCVQLYLQVNGAGPELRIEMVMRGCRPVEEEVRGKGIAPSLVLRGPPQHRDPIDGGVEMPEVLSPARHVSPTLPS